MADAIPIPEEFRASLAGKTRAEVAMTLLTSPYGPVGALGAFEPHVAALAYLVWMARNRARAPGNMLSGRPFYEADETLRGRVLAAASCSGSAREFAVKLFGRLNLDLASLPARDLLWWHMTQRAIGDADSWHAISDDTTLNEVLCATSLLSDLMHALKESPDVAA